MKKRSKDFSKRQKGSQFPSWLLINGLFKSQNFLFSCTYLYFARVEKKKQTQKTQKLHDHEKEQKNNTQSQAFEQWKRKKDEQIKLQKSTKKVEEKVHKKPWCPARSIEYDYVKPPQPLPHEQSKHNMNSSSTSSLSTSQSSVTATLKSVKVCCQTLEYWCTCQK